MISRLSRRRALGFGGAACAAALLNGCATAPTRAGLYLAAPDGAPRWITDTIGPPAWSPNGQNLAWGDEHGLSVWSADGDRVAQLATTPVVGRPAWSPDGSAVAFMDPHSRQLQRLEVRSGSTSPLAKLFEGFDTALRPPVMTRGGPAWSPDGSQLAFVCWDGYGDELCIVRADGSKRDQLTTLGEMEQRAGKAARSSVTAMAWSPDNTALAVAVQAEAQGAAAGIFRVDLSLRSGNRLTKLTANAPMIWDFRSNDLVFSARVEGRSDVYRLSAEGGQPNSMTSNVPEGGREPTLALDGALACVSGTRIAVIRPGSPDVAYLEEAGLAGASPALNNDGKQIAFVALPRPIDQYP